MATRWDAHAYDISSAPQQAWTSEVPARLDGIPRDAAVLDVGCGTARLTESLLALVPQGRVLAIDASGEMVAFGRARPGGNAPVWRQDVLDLETARTGPVILENPGELLQRLQIGRVDLCDPAAQVLLGGLRVGQHIEAVELLSERVRAHGLERLGEQLVRVWTQQHGSEALLAIAKLGHCLSKGLAGSVTFAVNPKATLALIGAMSGGSTDTPTGTPPTLPRV